MGILRLRTIRNIGLRSEPTLEVRVEQYSKFFHREGIIDGNERIIVGVRGGGIAIVTALPESLSKQCQRMGVKYKLGDAIIIVDMLVKINHAIGAVNTTPPDSVDYIRNNAGKLLQRTILLSSVVLPEIVDGMSRSIISCNLLPPGDRVNGLDVHRMLLKDVEMLREREIEIFSCHE